MNNSAILDEFFAGLAKAGRGLLLLDYDGTLAPFVEDRMEARPVKGLDDEVRAIVRQGKTRVVFITGRPCRELLKVSGLDIPVEVWGCHGREFLDAGGNLSVIGVSSDGALDLKVAESIAERIIFEGGFEGAFAELKTGCLAVHWRKVFTERRKELETLLREAWRSFASDKLFSINGFDGGLELSFGPRSKGDAVKEMLDHHGQEGVAAAFLGDDLTDEDGFGAIKGHGLSALVRNGARDTLADVRLTMPLGIFDFLHRWKKTLGEEEQE